MIIIKKGERESIEKMLKRYKRKTIKYGVHKKLKSLKEYEKPSTAKRKQLSHAKYKQQIQSRKDSDI